MILVRVLDIYISVVFTVFLSEGKSPCVDSWKTYSNCQFSGRDGELCNHNFHEPGESTCCALDDENVNSLSVFQSNNGTNFNINSTVEDDTLWLVQKVPGENLDLICQANITMFSYGGTADRWLWWCDGDCLCTKSISKAMKYEVCYNDDNWTTVLEVSLQKSNLTKSNTSYYYLCLASKSPNLSGYNGMRNVSVEVKELELEVTTENKTKVYVDEGKEARLVCSAVGYPKPDEFIWTRQDKPFNKKNTKVTNEFPPSNYKMNTTLTILDVQLKDNGTYYCIANISRFNETGSRSITLVVKPKKVWKNWFVALIVGGTLLAFIIYFIYWKVYKYNQHHDDDSSYVSISSCDCNPQPEEPRARVYIICCPEDSKSAEEIAKNIKEHGEKIEKPVKVLQNLRPENGEVYISDYSQMAGSCHRIVAILSNSMCEQAEAYEMLNNLYHNNLTTGKFIPVKVSNNVNIPGWIKHRHILCYKDKYFWTNLLHKTVCSLDQTIFSSLSNASQFPITLRNPLSYGSTERANCSECSYFSTA